MLFIETQSLRHSLERSKRIQLLEELEQQNLKPLIRSARLNCFGNTLLGAERVAELERAIVESLEAENQPYVRGEIFCLDDHVFFLLFDDENPASPQIRAGIVYSERTTEPFRKLDSFCNGLRSHILSTSETLTEGETLNLRNGNREDQACRRVSSNSSRSRIRIPCSPVCARKQWSGAFARPRFWKIRARASSCDAPKTLILRAMPRNCSPETFHLPITSQ